MVIIMASDQVRHSVDCGAGTAPFLAVNSATIVVSLFSFFLPSLTRNYLQLHNLTQTLQSGDSRQACLHLGLNLS